MFYAEHNRYGINTTTTIRRGNREIIVSAGNLYRFASKQARDAFVSDGGRNRGALTASAARRCHATGDLSSAVWDDANYMKSEWEDAAGYDVFIEPRA